MGLTVTKLPFIQFYPSDFLQDTRILSLAGRGAWMDLLCAMWVAPERGKLEWTMDQLTNFLGCSAELSTSIIDELMKSGVGVFVTDGNGNVTVKSRRMQREESQRKQLRARVQRHRNASCNASVTEKKRRIFQKPYIRSHISEEEDKIAARLHKTKAAWPPDDEWLLRFLKSQPFLEHAIDYLDDYSWWEDVAKAVGGLEPEFVEPEFAKMSAWYKENNQRRPTAKGTRRFIRHWLEKAKSQRRFHVTTK